MKEDGVQRTFFAVKYHQQRVLPVKEKEKEKKDILAVKENLSRNVEEDSVKSTFF